MLGLRLDEPVPCARRASSTAAGRLRRRRWRVARLTEAGLVELVDGGIRLTSRGSLLGDAVTAELIA